MKLPSVLCICATNGRHTLLERSVRMFIDQDYKGNHILFIYNNSQVEQKVVEGLQLPPNKRIIVHYQFKDSITEESYTSLGEIYNDIFRIPIKIGANEPDLVCFWDDDDLFLSSHISKGVEGHIRAETIAYKPKYSYYRSIEGVKLANNNFEPSIFVDYEWVKSQGFFPTTSDQHLKWLEPLIRLGQIFEDPDGEPTLIYNWGDTHVTTYKSSGDPKNSHNFLNYRRNSTDHGDGIITPISSEEAAQFLKIDEEKINSPKTK